MSGRVAIVTGAGRNIGRATALTLVRDGFDVVIHAGSDRAAAEEVRREAEAAGRRAIAIVADLSRKAEVDGMVAQTIATFGRVDVLVNNAAVRPHRPLIEITEAEWRYVLGVNLDAPFFCCQAVVPFMIRQGSGCIVNMVGTSSFNGGVEMAHINASKTGLLGLSKSLAVELGEHGIRVNTVVLGRIDTVRKLPAPGTGGPLIDQIPLRRNGRVDDPANLIAFLVSERASYITGQAIHVNGGTFLG